MQLRKKDKVTNLKIIGGFCLLGLAIISAVMISTTFAKSGENNTEQDQTTPQITTYIANQSQEVPATLVKLRLYDVGILPRQLTVPAGNIRFAVEDFYGSECKLEIAQEENDQRLPLKKLGKVKAEEIPSRLRKVLSFAPGRYWISMEGKPDNRMLLIVEASQEGK